MLTVSARRFDGSEDALANENLTTGGVCAETGSEVRHRADGSVVVPSSKPIRRASRSRLDPDMSRARSPLSPRRGKLIEPLVRRKRKPDCAKFVIVHRERVVEEHHQPHRAGKMLERPPCSGINRPSMPWYSRKTSKSSSGQPSRRTQ